MRNHPLGRVLRRAATLAGLLALSAGLAVPVASSDELHCAVPVVDVLPDGTMVTADPVCFGSLAESVAYATRGRVQLPADVTGPEIYASGFGGFDSTQSGATAIHWTGQNGTGSSATIGVPSCSTTHTWVVTGIFINNIESTKNACWRTRHYDQTSGYGDRHDTFTAGQLDNLTGFLNRTEMIKYP